MFRVPEAMHSWLAQVSDDASIGHGNNRAHRYHGDDDGSDGRPRKRRRFGFDMVTPSSSAAHSASPSKKRKMDDKSASDPEPAAASSGRLTRTLPSSLPDVATLSTNPPLIASSCLNDSVKGSRRSGSPIKNIAGLKWLEKPVYFDCFPEDAASAPELPNDVRQLYSDMYSAIQYKKGIYPAEVRAQIEAIKRANHPPPLGVSGT